MNLIFAILFTLTPVKSVQAQGYTLHLSKSQVLTLRAYRVSQVNQVLNMPGTVRNNDTADLMIKLLK